MDMLDMVQWFALKLSIFSSGLHQSEVAGSVKDFGVQ